MNTRQPTASTMLWMMLGLGTLPVALLRGDTALQAFEAFGVQFLVGFFIFCICRTFGAWLDD